MQRMVNTEHTLNKSMDENTENFKLGSQRHNIKPSGTQKLPGNKSNSLLDEEVRLPELAATNITSKFEKANRSDVVQYSQIS